MGSFVSKQVAKIENEQTRKLVEARVMLHLRNAIVSGSFGVIPLVLAGITRARLIPVLFTFLSFAGGTFTHLILSDLDLVALFETDGKLDTILRENGIDIETAMNLLKKVTRSDDTRTTSMRPPVVSGGGDSGTDTPSTGGGGDSGTDTPSTGGGGGGGDSGTDTPSTGGGGGGGDSGTTRYEPEPLLPSHSEGHTLITNFVGPFILPEAYYDIRTVDDDTLNDVPSDAVSVAARHGPLIKRRWESLFSNMIRYLVMGGDERVRMFGPEAHRKGMYNRWLDYLTTVNEAIRDIDPTDTNSLRSAHLENLERIFNVPSNIWSDTDQPDIVRNMTGRHIVQRLLEFNARNTEYQRIDGDSLKIAHTWVGVIGAYTRPGFRGSQNGLDEARMTLTIYMLEKIYPTSGVAEVGIDRFGNTTDTVLGSSVMESAAPTVLPTLPPPPTSTPEPRFPNISFPGRGPVIPPGSSLGGTTPYVPGTTIPVHIPGLRTGVVDPVRPDGPTADTSVTVDPFLAMEPPITQFF